MALQVCGVTGFYDAPRNLWLNVPYILSTNEQGDTLWTWKNKHPREGILQSMVSKGGELWLAGTWLTWGNDFYMLLMRFNLNAKSATYATFGDSSVEIGSGITSTIDGGFALAGRKSHTKTPPFTWSKPTTTAVYNPAACKLLVCKSIEMLRLP